MPPVRTDQDPSVRFHTAMAKRDNAFNAIGIRTDCDQTIRFAVKDAAFFAAKVVGATASQAAYDELVNRPCGVLEDADLSPAKSFRRALPGAIGEYLEWEPDAAIELCADILEDVNAHTESAAVRAMLGQGDETPATNGRPGLQTVPRIMHMAGEIAEARKLLGAGPEESLREAAERAARQLGVLQKL